MTIFHSCTSVRLDYVTPTAESTGTMRAARPMSRAQIKRVTLSWNGVSQAIEQALREHFETYGQRGVAFTYQPPPLLSHTEASYVYEDELSVDRTNPRNVQMRCVLIEAMAAD